MEHPSVEEDPQALSGPLVSLTRFGSRVDSILSASPCSAITANEIFWAIGTESGDIFIMDYSGKELRHIKHHQKRITSLTTDDSCEWIGSSSLDGQVTAANVYSDEVHTYSHHGPILSMDLTRNYGSSKERTLITGGQGGKLRTRKRGWLLKIAPEKLLHDGEGPIYRISASSRNCIAWANNYGIKVLQMNTGERLCFLEPPPDTPPPDICPPVILWYTPPAAAPGTGPPHTLDAPGVAIPGSNGSGAAPSAAGPFPASPAVHPASSPMFGGMTVGGTSSGDAQAQAVPTAPALLITAVGDVIRVVRIVPTLVEGKNEEKKGHKDIPGNGSAPNTPAPNHTPNLHAGNAHPSPSPSPFSLFPSSTPSTGGGNIFATLGSSLLNSTRSLRSAPSSSNATNSNHAAGNFPHAPSTPLTGAVSSTPDAGSDLPPLAQRPSNPLSSAESGAEIQAYPMHSAPDTGSSDSGKGVVAGVSGADRGVAAGVVFRCVVEHGYVAGLAVYGDLLAVLTLNPPEDNEEIDGNGDANNGSGNSNGSNEPECTLLFIDCQVSTLLRAPLCDAGKISPAVVLAAVKVPLRGLNEDTVPKDLSLLGIPTDNPSNSNNSNAPVVSTSPPLLLIGSPNDCILTTPPSVAQYMDWTINHLSQEEVLHTLLHKPQLLKVATARVFLRNYCESLINSSVHPSITPSMTPLTTQKYSSVGCGFLVLSMVASVLLPSLHLNPSSKDEEIQWIERMLLHLCTLHPLLAMEVAVLMAPRDVWKNMEHQPLGRYVTQVRENIRSGLLYGRNAHEANGVALLDFSFLHAGNSVGAQAQETPSNAVAISQDMEDHPTDPEKSASHTSDTANTSSSSNSSTTPFSALEKLAYTPPSPPIPPFLSTGLPLAVLQFLVAAQPSLFLLSWTLWGQLLVASLYPSVPAVAMLACTPGNALDKTAPVPFSTIENGTKNVAVEELLNAMTTTLHGAIDKLLEAYRIGDLVPISVSEASTGSDTSVPSPLFFLLTTVLGDFYMLSRQPETALRQCLRINRQYLAAVSAAPKAHANNAKVPPTTDSALAKPSANDSSLSSATSTGSSPGWETKLLVILQQDSSRSGETANRTVAFASLPAVGTQKSNGVLYLIRQYGLWSLLPEFIEDLLLLDSQMLIQFLLEAVQVYFKEVYVAHDTSGTEDLFFSDSDNPTVENPSATAGSGDGRADDMTELCIPLLLDKLRQHPKFLIQFLNLLSTMVPQYYALPPFQKIHTEHVELALRYTPRQAGTLINALTSVDLEYIRDLCTSESATAAHRDLLPSVLFRLGEEIRAVSLCIHELNDPSRATALLLSSKSSAEGWIYTCREILASGDSNALGVLLDTIPESQLQPRRILQDIPPDLRIARLPSRIRTILQSRRDYHDTLVHVDRIAQVDALELHAQYLTRRHRGLQVEEALCAICCTALTTPESNPVKSSTLNRARASNRPALEYAPDTYRDARRMSVTSDVLFGSESGFSEVPEDTLSPANEDTVMHFFCGHHFHTRCLPTKAPAGHTASPTKTLPASGKNLTATNSSAPTNGPTHGPGSYRRGQSFLELLPPSRTYSMVAGGSGRGGGVVDAYANDATAAAIDAALDSATRDVSAYVDTPLVGNDTGGGHTTCPLCHRGGSDRTKKRTNEMVEKIKRWSN